ncbi:MAG TPA: hypothetical protein VD816_11690 [Ohtaekwangia sp.]|nr:hypothetical protein [Ohtaekwangia sp.]
MNKKISRLFLCLGLAMAFVACKDDDDKKASNQFTFEGDKFVLQEAWYDIDEEFDEDENPVFEYEIYLEGTDGTKVSGVWFDLFSSQDEDLPAGTYTFDGDYTQNNLTFNYAGGFFYDTDTQEEEDFGSVTGGTVKVTKSGDKHTFTFDLTMEGGKKLAGSFSGELQIED